MPRNPDAPVTMTAFMNGQSGAIICPRATAHPVGLGDSPSAPSKRPPTDQESAWCSFGAAFEVFEVIAPPAPMAPPHVSPWTGVLFLLQGRITAVVDGTSYDVEPGGLVVVPAGTPSTFGVVGESARLL